MRYGRANAGGVGVVGSESEGFGEDVGRLSLIEFECTRGGGSMNVDVCDGTIGSGRSGISSEFDAVSIVIWLVGFVTCRRL